jgi:outer membrane protein assembly factor BamB
LVFIEILFLLILAFILQNRTSIKQILTHIMPLQGFSFILNGLRLVEYKERSLMKKKYMLVWLLVLIVPMIIACGDEGAFSSSDNGKDKSGGGGDGDGGDGSLWSTLISTESTILRGNPLFGFQLFSSPAVSDDGTIYVGSTDTRLYALDQKGIIIWTYETGDQIVASPAIGSDGTVYIGSADRQLYAINPDGTLKWVYPTKAVLTSSPALAADGTIYVAGTFLDQTFICSVEDQNPVQLGSFYAINQNGTLQWSITLSGPVNSSPVIADDGTIYIGSGGHLVEGSEPENISYDRIDPCNVTTPIPASDANPFLPVNGHVYAINPDGTIKWDFYAMGNVDSSAAIGADGTIYIGSDYATWGFSNAVEVFPIGSLTTGFLYAINPDGTLIWVTDLYGDVKSSPAIGSDGTIYVGSDKEDVFALNADDGTIKWVFPTRGPVRSSPALAMDGTIFIGSSDSRLYALNPDGTLRSDLFATEGIDFFDSIAGIASSPTILANGTVYFAAGGPASDVPFVDGDATFYAIDGTVGLADTDWPKFRRDLRNTGRQ